VTLIQVGKSIFKSAEAAQVSLNVTEVGEGSTTMHTSRRRKHRSAKAAQRWLNEVHKSSIAGSTHTHKSAESSERNSSQQNHKDSENSGFKAAKAGSTMHTHKSAKKAQVSGSSSLLAQ
jgi:hypothetical protein